MPGAPDVRSRGGSAPADTDATFTIAQEAITAFKAVLDQEIEQLKRKGISFLNPFNSFTHTTKSKKSAMLGVLLQTTDLARRQDTARIILNNPQKYSRELNTFHTRRTVDLLEAIRDGNRQALEAIKNQYAETEPLIRPDQSHGVN